jgi:Iap family predicted aminopeptidase
MVRKAIRCILPGLFLFFAAAAFAQSEQYLQLPQSVIEKRLLQYTALNPERGATIEKLFHEAGCRGERLREQSVEESASPNVICTLPGRSNNIIIVGAHFDHVRKGDGVVDNWSGASLLPSLYESLSVVPREHTYIFISFTDEEKGFVGSTHYAEQLTEDEVKRIQGMINMDTLGLGPTEVWVSKSDPELVKEVTEVASELKLPLREMNVDDYGNSDGKPFRERNIPTITFHSVTIDTLSILHSNKDNLEAIKLNDYYESYKLIAAYLAALDSELEK